LEDTKGKASVYVKRENNLEKTKTHKRKRTGEADSLGTKLHKHHMSVPREKVKKSRQSKKKRPSSVLVTDVEDVLKHKKKKKKNTGPL